MALVMLVLLQRPTACLKVTAGSGGDDSQSGVPTGERMLMVEMSDYSEDDAATSPSRSGGSSSASASTRDFSVKPLPKPHPPVRPPSQADIDGMPR
jgi:hypothetical protein